MDLEDWLLPIVWGKGETPFKLERAYPEDIENYVKSDLRIQAELEGIKRVGAYGFMGRDVDILEIENLLHRRNMVLVKGMGGTGKTTLLGHMAHWWIRTGWIEHVVYFGYDRKPYYAEEMVNAIAERVMSKSGYGQVLAEPQIETKAMLVADFLRESKETPGVLAILDNMESITGTEQAVGHKLDKVGQERLKQALKILGKSSIKILLGSRSDEAWLAGETFQTQVYRLEGLDNEARNSLAEAILTHTGAGVDKTKTPTGTGEEAMAYKRLMDILAGYPLPMEIILPHMKGRSAGELIEMLTRAGVDFTGGAISEAVFQCTNVSYSLLSETAKTGILVLAPFTSFLNMAFKEKYLEELHGVGSTVMASLTQAHLDEALAQAAQQGLIKEELPGCYSIQPVFPFFLGLKVEETLDNEAQSGLQDAFCGYMAFLANAYDGLMESKTAPERQVGFVLFERDRENLYKAMHRVLDRQSDFYPLYTPFSKYYFDKPLPVEAIGFMEGMIEKLDMYEDRNRDPEFLAGYGIVLMNLATQYMNIKDFPAAKEKYKTSIDVLQKAGRKHETAAGYHQLGWVAQEERDFPASLQYYAVALPIFLEYNDPHNTKIVLSNLGILFQAWSGAAGSETPIIETISRLECAGELKEFLEKMVAGSR